jgi:hypothetical protein
MNPTTTLIAYISEGKLYLKSADGEAKLVDSPFVQGMIDRAERARQRNDWKDAGGMAWNFRAGGMKTGMLPASGSQLRRVQWTSVTRGPSSDEVIYGISAEHVGGIFLHHIPQDHERRLLHRNAFVPADLDRNRADGTLAMSVGQKDGTACISIMKADGKGLRDLTEGDSIDQSPAWTQTPTALLFQSAGIMRNEAGMMVEIGPYAVVKLDVESGNLTTVVSDDAHDYLTPRVSDDGSTYYIRRPYEPLKKPSWRQQLLDAVLFPYRLVRAIIHFLNVFSIMFSSKPLLTAGGLEREGPDLQRMMLWGRLIDAKQLAKAARNSDAAGLVPTSWELRSRKAGSDVDEPVAKGVAAFDVAGSTVVYTDGSTIWQCNESGAPTEIARGHLIERVLIVH